mmetsp:Transcript_91527/g.162912  ORF Transcript_91527/g.162912 Transcript_91527/m.162912 type:complete len:158 (-) Transcript_91527:65-538(-)|eukprot:CAMPEP_0197638146 /NCGR_PEP_ID=MMETSP1338-20131121/13149_1 /TAXON_ID=43686 ORGANISM="Pelagodinium beii, Strain RCC1491" /NCGR_SAMPLE_ID=MMETSP1338 /ASSEMBLY_ACC=CAM_ASM_000754 /LENGTH=157 /DNA_ID=CAMNT_0043210669 /DNA_START=73 /DNA_END=546 /DNA_ORIENTATION=+
MAFQVVVLMLLALVAAQETVGDPPAPPPPPPVPPPLPPVPSPPARSMAAEGKTEEDMDPDELMHQARGRHLSTLAPSGHHHEKGAWLYGDYINALEGVEDPVGCAKACEADADCYHWNFHVMKHRCDLKAESGGANSDKDDWVYGHAARYKPGKGEL